MGCCLGVAPGLATWGESGLPDCPADDRCGNESMRGTNDPPTGEPGAEEGGGSEPRFFHT